MKIISSSDQEKIFRGLLKTDNIDISYETETDIGLYGSCLGESLMLQEQH